MQPQFDPDKVYEADYRVSGDGEVVRSDKRQSRLKGLFGPVGVAITNALPLQAPFCGTGKLLGNQAYPMACPAGRHHPVVFGAESTSIS